jgi:hypothetical protein
MKTRRTLLSNAVAAFGWIWQAYVLLGWCLIALFLTRNFSTRPVVNHVWVYDVIGFLVCLSPVSFMNSSAANSDASRQIIGLGMSLLAATGFIGFALVPNLVMPWAWILRIF